jgi:hypothetical protein
MNAWREEAKKQLEKQVGKIPIEKIDRLGFTECALEATLLAPFTALKKFFAVAMQPRLTSLNFLAAHASTLEFLDVSDNNLISFAESPVFPKVYRLIAVNNKIPLSEAAAIAAKFPALLAVDLSGNPAAEATDSRERLRNHFPNAAAINGVDAKSGELVDIMDSDDEEDADGDEGMHEGFGMPEAMVDGTDEEVEDEEAPKAPARRERA